MQRHSRADVLERRARWIRKRLAWMDRYYQASKWNPEWHRQVHVGRWSKNKPLGCSCWMCQGDSFGQNRQRIYREMNRYESAGWGA